MMLNFNCKCINFYVYYQTSQNGLITGASVGAGPIIPKSAFYICILFNILVYSEYISNAIGKPYINPTISTLTSSLQQDKNHIAFLVKENTI